MSWFTHPQLQVSIRVRVRSLSAIDFESGCWNWLGSLSHCGYGAIEHFGKSWQAHRLSYELFRHPIPAGLVLDHLCRNRACINPWHLEAVTHRVNILRGEGRAALAARAITCLAGHPLSGDNLYLTSRGWRVCRICSRAKVTRYRARQGATA